MKRTLINGAHRRTAMAGSEMFATIYPGPNNCLAPKLAEPLVALAGNLNMPVVAIVQYGPCPVCGNDDESNQICSDLYSAFQETLATLHPNQKIALLLESPGGYAKAAYRIARLLRRHCGGFTAVIPSFAKSAATLLALGADRIIMGPDAELGPLDAQLTDFDREQQLSALEVVQSLERLNNAAMDAVDEQVMFWSKRSGKKIDTLLPMTMRFVSNMMRPLFDKIDTVQYTQYARILKVAQEYAARLLLPNYDLRAATQIARALTETYPEHGFAIYPDEAENLGLRIQEPSEELKAILRTFSFVLTGNPIIGLIYHDRKTEQPPAPVANGKKSSGRGKRQPASKNGSPD